MDNKLGVYICSGCSIGESVNTEELAKIAKTGRWLRAMSTQFSAAKKEWI